ncbi:MAG: hypothetical protein H6707_04280 [Deltaproteobacteria bacterium]|nr:hypothetical protein [Deltaproteobacteria bacterium]
MPDCAMPWPLSGARKKIQLTLRVAALLCAVSAMVSYALPAHQVYDVRWGFCLHSDCKSTPPTVAKQATIDSNYDHSGPWPLGVIALLAAICLLALGITPRWWTVGSLTLASGGALVLMFNLTFNLAHLFDKVVYLWANRVHSYAIGGLALAALTFPSIAIILRGRRSKQAS